MWIHDNDVIMASAFWKCCTPVTNNSTVDPRFKVGGEGTSRDIYFYNLNYEINIIYFYNCK